MTKMIITTDTKKCVGHAMCNSADSEIFELDDMGYNTTETRVIETDDPEHVRLVASSCPEAIITAEIAE